jgi:hypothetical protein
VDQWVRDCANTRCGEATSHRRNHHGDGDGNDRIDEHHRHGGRRRTRHPHTGRPDAGRASRFVPQVRVDCIDPDRVLILDIAVSLGAQGSFGAAKDVFHLMCARPSPGCSSDEPGPPYMSEPSRR